MLATWLGIASVGGVVFGALVYFPRVGAADRSRLGLVGRGAHSPSLFWVWQPIMLVLGLLLKWLLVGRRRPGVHVRRYPLCETACSTYYSILADLLPPVPARPSPSSGSRSQWAAR